MGLRHEFSRSSAVDWCAAAARAGRPQRRRVERLVAPLSDGMRSGRVGLAKRAEPRAQLGGVQLRLLPGGEVAALVELVVVDQVGVGLLCPTPRHLIELVREDAHGY